MLAIQPQYITNNSGKKISVILPIKNFKSIMDALDELEDIRLYDASKKSNELSTPIDEAFRIIETKRNKKEYAV